jgi:prepilin-type N-terminal cleavage/methylation domain-containing protein
MPARRGPAGDSGFTLIEVLVSIVVLGIIASGVAAAITLFFRTAEGTATRLALSHDSQLLATYLVPDLDNLTCSPTAPAAVQCGATPGQPVIVTAGSGTCAAGSSPFQELSMQYTDVGGGQSYVADYQVVGSSIVRRFGPAGQALTPDITVIHNLKQSTATCFSTLPQAAPWTMTVTTGRLGPDTTDDFTFSVTGGGRVTTQPAQGPPNLTSLIARDTNNDGKVDQVIATFDQPLNLGDRAGASQWVLGGDNPEGATVQQVAISGNRAILTLTAAKVDTAPDFDVTLKADPNGVRNAANQPAAFGPSPVSDWMAPVPISIVSQDDGNNGKVDHVTVTFSEPLDSSYHATAPWTLLGTDATIQQVAVSGSTAWLILNEGTKVDTAPNLTLALQPGGIQDAHGNQAWFDAMPVSDGMAPVATSLVSMDTNHDGKVDQVVVTFSEQLAGPYTAGTTPWTLVNPPAGVTLKAVAISGTIATLTLNKGSTVDTVAKDFKITLTKDPGGIRDAAGNQSSFDQMAVSDGMGPIVVGLSSTNVAGGTAGRIEAGDTLTVTFSEPLAASSLPANPTLTVTPGQHHADTLMISGVATVDLGGQDSYVDNAAATFSASLSTSGNVVTVVVGPNTSGAANVRTAQSGTTMEVTPFGSVTDTVVPGNPADGVFTSPQTVLF